MTTNRDRAADRKAIKHVRDGQACLRSERNRVCDLAERALERDEKIEALVEAKRKIPCSCFMPPNYDGCDCGNYDDAHSQGFAQGWNAAIDALDKGEGKP